MPAIVDWLCAATGVEPQPEAVDHPPPVRRDFREADANIKVYLDDISAKPVRACPSAGRRLGVGR
jgi:hypothetical protein